MRPFPNVCEPDGEKCPDRKPGCQGTCPKMVAAKAQYEQERAEDLKRRKTISDIECVKAACIRRLRQYQTEVRRNDRER